MNETINKVCDILKTRVLRSYPDPGVEPVVHTNDLGQFAPSGILYSDGCVALFDQGRRIFGLDGVGPGAFNTNVSLAVSVLCSLGVISESERNEFKEWLRDEAGRERRKTDIEVLKARAREYGYDLVARE